MSDLHFGAATSILTAVDPVTLEADINRDSEAMVSLVECLGYLLERNEAESPPRLVLAGDILELALTTTNEAATVFARFMRLLAGGGGELFDPSIIYVPGNHDHHLWETARERQYAEYLRDEDPPLPLSSPPWHATHLFPWRRGMKVKNRDVESHLLTTLLDYSECDDVDRVIAMYPNAGLMSADGRSVCTVMHHGHFTEWIYLLMTELRMIVFPGMKTPPEEVWDLEAENYAWIEFLWGTLGRSGEVGESVERFYDMLKSDRATRRLIASLASALPGRFGLEGCRKLMARICIRLALMKIWKHFRGLERGLEDWPLSEDSSRRLDEYIGHYLRGQLDRERGEDLPARLNFVFGHTHKPFEEIRKVKGVDSPVHVYNTGGWVVDHLDVRPRRGASIVVIDEDGNAASIRMYNQAASGPGYRVSVAKAGGAAAENPLHDELSRIVDSREGPWADFSGAAARSVEERRANLEKVIERAAGA